jgi:quinol monooxygenase YgiN
MSFTQVMTVTSHDPDGLRDLLAGWHDEQFGTAPGYQGARLLEDRGHPGRWVIEVDFSSYDDAERNNGRPETQAWAEELRGLIVDDVDYQDYDVVFESE